MIIRSLPFLLSVVVWLGCCSALRAQRDDERAQAQILFLTFKIEKDATNKTGEAIRLVNNQKVAGHLKQAVKTPHNIAVGDLICTFLDKQDVVLATEVMEDPLTASVEYADESGLLKRAFLDQREADLFLRVSHNPLFFKLRISKVTSNGELVLLADFLNL